MSDEQNAEESKLAKAVASEIPESMKRLLETIKHSQAPWGVATQNIPNYAAPWLEATRAFSVSMKPLALLVDEHKNEIARIGATLQKASSILGATLQPMMKQIENGFANLVPVIGAALTAYKERLASYPSLAQHCELLAKQGWFVSLFFGLSEFDEIAAAAGQDVRQLEKILANAYRTSIEEHAAAILHEFPERDFAISPAVAAHLRGEYALSVPVFFSQADGVCASTVGKHIFTGKSGGERHISSLAREELAKLNLEAEEGVELMTLLEIALWNPLTEHQPIAFNDARREEMGYSGLNRHCVLHGESLDYATEANSLKAFSLLSYVASLLAQKKKAAES